MLFQVKRFSKVYVAIVVNDFGISFNFSLIPGPFHKLPIWKDKFPFTMKAFICEFANIHRSIKEFECSRNLAALIIFTLEYRAVHIGNLTIAMELIFNHFPKYFGLRQYNLIKFG